jgi:hypothetical protein
VILDANGKPIGASAGGTCDHGLTFDIEAARQLLNKARPRRGVDPALDFILGNPAAAEIRKRWPRGWFTTSNPCPKGCGFLGTAYASYEHYIMGDW